MRCRSFRFAYWVLRSVLSGFTFSGWLRWGNFFGGFSLRLRMRDNWALFSFTLGFVPFLFWCTSRPSLHTLWFWGSAPLLLAAFVFADTHLFGVWFTQKLFTLCDNGSHSTCPLWLFTALFSAGSAQISLPLLYSVYHRASSSGFGFLLRRFAFCLTFIQKVMPLFQSITHSFCAFYSNFCFFWLILSTLTVRFFLEDILFGALPGWTFLAFGCWPAFFGSRSLTIFIFGCWLIFSWRFSGRFFLFWSVMEALWIAILQFGVKIDDLRDGRIFELFPFLNDLEFMTVVYFFLLTFRHLAFE